MDKDKKTGSKKEPNIIKKGFSLANSLLRYAREGFPNVSQDIYEQRMLTCNSCDDLDKKMSTCKLCGCYVEYKARMETESCPKNKW
tara:strand:+ start:207 stop:464 length:258 start_codon:yes stop_codon:yes gene_type:complete